MHTAKLAAYKKEVEREIQKYLSTLKSSELYTPMSYALSSRGKRLRPMLTKLMAHGLGKNRCVNLSALAIELFHTASLIADDLPCMDDDDTRRGQPSLHKKFGEGPALLVSFAFLTEGFSKIEENGRLFKERGYGSEEEADKRVRIALEETCLLSGPKGVVLGQYHDIEQTKTDSEEEFEKMYYLKTGTLFQGAFTLGYIFGGGDLEKLPMIQKLSKHLGFAFQIRDDFEDIEEECLSYVKKFGEQNARLRVAKEIEGFYEALDMLGVRKDCFEGVIKLLFEKERLQTSPHALL